MFMNVYDFKVAWLCMYDFQLGIIVNKFILEATIT